MLWCACVNACFSLLYTVTFLSPFSLSSLSGRLGASNCPRIEPFHLVGGGGGGGGKFCATRFSRVYKYFSSVFCVAVCGLFNWKCTRKVNHKEFESATHSIDLYQLHDLFKIKNLKKRKQKQKDYKQKNNLYSEGIITVMLLQSEIM